MKTLFTINRGFVIANLVLYLTIYLGALFQLVLGAVQIIISLYILKNFKSLSNNIKLLFTIYCALAITTLTVIFTISSGNDYMVIVYFIVPMLLALFHLYITYLIKHHENTSTLSQDIS